MAIPVKSRARQATPAKTNKPVAVQPKPVQSTPVIARAKPSGDQALRFVQNAALLQVLDGFRPPAADISKRKEMASEDYTLVQFLAFLSAADADPQHVAAVAVEELPVPANPRDPLVRVHVAINKSSPKSNNKELNTIVSAFRDLFSGLAQCTKSMQNHQRYELRNGLLARIVHLCRAKIIRRLGHPDDKGIERKRPFLGARLHKAVCLVQDVQFLQRPSSVQSFLDCSVPVLQALQNLPRNSPSDDDLVLVIHAVYRFHKTLGPILNSVIDEWTGSGMNLEQRESLVRHIGSIARYKNCANYLCRLACREESLLWRGRVEVVAVQPSKADFELRVPDRTAHVSLRTYLAPGSLGRLDTALKQIRGDTYSVEREFGQMVSNWATHRKGTIHAEVQIAHSLASSRRRAAMSAMPVICASKHACYLCHAFFVAHADLDEPATHGRLYPGWRLPAGWQAGRSGHNAAVLRRLGQFNVIMEGDIDMILARLSRPNAKMYGNTCVLEDPLFAMESPRHSLAATVAPQDPSRPPSPQPSGPPVKTIDRSMPPPPLPAPRHAPLVLLQSGRGVAPSKAPEPCQLPVSVRSLRAALANVDPGHLGAYPLGKRRRECAPAGSTVVHLRSLSYEEEAKERAARGGFLPVVDFRTVSPNDDETLYVAGNGDLFVSDGPCLCKVMVEEAPAEEASVDEVPAKRASIQKPGKPSGKKSKAKKSVLDILKSASASGNTWM